MVSIARIEVKYQRNEVERVLTKSRGPKLRNEWNDAAPKF